MSDSVKILTKAAVNKHLAQLKVLLCGLQSTLPFGDTLYNFVNYQPHVEDCSNYNEAGAVNHDLEVMFCPAGRQSGPIELRKRGNGLVAVVEVLRECTTTYPNDVVLLHKWIVDLTELL